MYGELSFCFCSTFLCFCQLWYVQNQVCGLLLMGCGVGGVGGVCVLGGVGWGGDDNVRVQSATQWTASVQALHMSKPVITFVFKVLRNGLLRHKLYTCPNL